MARPRQFLKPDSWTPVFDRRSIDVSVLDRTGCLLAWAEPPHGRRVADPVDDPLSHACGLSYLSDDLPTDAVVRAHPLGQLPEEVRWQSMFSASLDHAIWFHRPMAVDQWHLHDFSCLHYGSGRGLTRVISSARTASMWRRLHKRCCSETIDRSTQ